MRYESRGGMDIQGEEQEVNEQELSTGCYKGCEILPFGPPSFISRAGLKSLCPLPPMDNSKELTGRAFERIKVEITVFRCWHQD
jgi:hypothetical protein